MSFLLEVATNLLANIVFWLLLGFLFFMGSRTVESKMVRFFGLGRSRQIQVLLSNLAEPYPDGRPRYSLSLHEFQAAQSVHKLFGAAPLRLPELVRGLVDGIWLHRQVQCQVDVSPNTSSSIAAETALAKSCIVVGGASRNSVRKYGLEDATAKATLAGEGFPQQPVPIPGEEVTVTIRHGDGNLQQIKACKNLAVIEKVNRTGGHVNFFCHGVRADTSCLAVEYLVRNWKQIAKDFGDADFVLVLGVPWETEYFVGYLEPTREAAVFTAPSTPGTS
ncbi:hypothetical protein OG225_06950 [Nocardia sp. NBC_01377]|uniref:hypothetical protein n=1 Tax=Nocardia sp. NBC_01377 TaxID=2903595 RepID=UPI003254F8B2